jgi:hypothetical protein
VNSAYHDLFELIEGYITDSADWIRLFLVYLIAATFALVSYQQLPKSVSRLGRVIAAIAAFAVALHAIESGVLAMAVAVLALYLAVEKKQ